MSRKKRSRAPNRPAGRTGPNPARPAVRPTGQPTNMRARIGLLIVAVVMVVVVVIVADLVIGALSHQGGGSSQTGTPAASSSQLGVVAQGNGGHWTNVSPDQLAQMLEHKDFTLVNVKTPYSSEIDGTDLYIPYNQLTARASELPQDRGVRILVYCLTGTTSKIAAQTLLDLGYTNVWSLDGGMAAWTASGRTLVNLNR